MFVIGIFEHVVWAPARRIGWIQWTQNKALTLFSLPSLVFSSLSVSLETAVMFDWQANIHSTWPDSLVWKPCFLPQPGQSWDTCQEKAFSISSFKLIPHCQRERERERKRQMLHISRFAFNHTQCLLFLTTAFMLWLVKDTWMRCFKVLNQFNRHSHMKGDTMVAV